MDNNQIKNEENTLSKITISTSKSKTIYGTLGNKYILISKIGKGLSSNVFSAKKKILLLEKSNLQLKYVKKNTIKKCLLKKDTFIKNYLILLI
jgi:hypothetical protein